MIENYKKTMKFLDTINPYKYLEARNKNRLQQLNQKKQELLDRESEENLKGFIIANKLKKRYENNLREILQKDEDGSKPPEDLKEEDEKSKFTEVKSNDKKIEENEPSTKKKKHKKEKENKKKKKKLLIIEK